MKIKFSRGNSSSVLNGLLTSNGLKVMLGRKGYRLLNQAFLFVAGSLDLAVRLVEYVAMPRLHIADYDLVRSLMGYKSGKMTGDVQIREPSQHMKDFKQFLQGM